MTHRGPFQPLPFCDSVKALFHHPFSPRNSGLLGSGCEDSTGIRLLGMCWTLSCTSQPSSPPPPFTHAAPQWGMLLLSFGCRRSRQVGELGQGHQQPTHLLFGLLLQGKPSETSAAGILLKSF